MNKTCKIISTLLAVFMLLGSAATLFTLNAFAEEADTNQAVDDGSETESTVEEDTEEEDGEMGEVDYVNDVFANPDEKLATMRLALKKGNYSLYVDDYSGEVACVNTLTGEKIFTNPYDVGAATGNEATKYEILSQLIVTFTDTTGQEKTFTSFEEAAEREQISVESIMNGVRVEYTIGRESSKILVPRLISLERFNKMIIAPLEEKFGDNLYKARFTDEDNLTEAQKAEIFEVQKILSYYMLYSKEKLESHGVTKAEKKKMDNIYGGIYDNLVNSDAQYARALKKFPIIETLAVFVFDPDASESELTKAEAVISKYCPEYTYEELEYDHLLTEYKSDDSNPPVFRMALEYTITSDGLSVRLPANGIRFNESLYTLSTIDVLPYMGAGNSAYSGYNFFPDGSGTLFDFEELNVSQTHSVTSKVYGTDFAYHEINGTYQKTVRYPVFGIKEDTTYYTYTKYATDSDEVIEKTVIAGAIVDAIKASSKGESQKACEGNAEILSGKYREIIVDTSTIETKSTEKRGFVAIIEEGDALASLSTYHAGALSDYNTIKMQFTPRPKDTYNISDSISVGSDTEWTVVSDRKYVGNYKIKYIMLSDAEKSTADNSVYDASWFGMAVAYRDYLTSNGIISKKTSEDVKSDIPLYIESFGSIETTEKIMSIPVTVMSPLTTFENIEDMYKDLAEETEDEIGIKNINFKLTGFANGGMKYTVPSKLKFEKVVGGNDGFQALLDAAEKVNNADSDANFGIFPDFDFVYSINSEMFDGYSSYKHAAQTIDGRYASKKSYSATQQKYVNYYEMAISPASFADFYEKLADNYFGKYQNIIGISMSTLGTDLNSDFDEDDPYNREDAKEYTVKAFEYFSSEQFKDAQIMTDGGNSFVWKYVDHILNVSLDSSRYNFSSNSVPFIGVVLHGSISFTGEPLNMEGDLQYAVLKAIENGASPYFVLSYQNTNALKDDKQLSKYYSVRYDIWKDDIKDVYETLNGVLGDVQDKYIVDHEFLTGSRVPDSDELTSDILKDFEANYEAEKNAAQLLEKEIAQAASIARENGRLAELYAAEAVVKALKMYNDQLSIVNKANVFDSSFYENVKAAYKEYVKVIDYVDYKDSSNSVDEELYAQYEKVNTIYNAVQSFNISYSSCSSIYDKLLASRNAHLSGESYANYRNMITAVYQSYGKGEILKEQIESTISMTVAEDKLDKVISEFKAGNADRATLDAAIASYCASKIDVSEFNKKILAYANGTLEDDALEEIRAEFATVKSAYNSGKATKEEFDAAVAEFDAAVQQYQSQTLNRYAIDAFIDEWLDVEPVSDDELNKAINNLRLGKIDEKEFDAILERYALQGLDKSKLTAAIDAYESARSVYDTANNGYTIKAEQRIDEEKYNKAVDAYEEAKSAFNTKLQQYQTNKKTTLATYKNALKTFKAARETFKDAQNKYNATDVSEEEYNSAVAAFGVAEAAFNELVANYVTSEMNAVELTAVVNEYKGYADAYSEYMASEYAFEQVINSGFAKDYDSCYALYLALENANYYSTIGKVVSAENSDTEMYEKYVSYIRAYEAVSKLESDIKAIQVKYGTFDNYTIARAQLDVLVELGYDKSVDADKKALYDKAVVLVNQSRRTAITNLASVDGTNLSALLEMMDEAENYLKLAIDAIDTLALSEGVTVDYADADDSSYGRILNISNYDEISEKSFIVKQAIDRARSTYYAIMADQYTAISDGRVSEYELNGHTLKTMRDGDGKTVYFYGTLETGYSYFQRNNKGQFEVYQMGTLNGSKTSSGESIYEYSSNSVKYYYTATLEGGYTYYSKDHNGVFTVAQSTVYNGERVATLNDGTVIFLDGTTYYSVNEDGTYTRYEYSKSIKSCADEARAAMENVKSNVKSVGESSLDKTIFADLEARIERNRLMSNKGNDTEEEVEVKDKYETENIVAVTYGNDDGSAYKTVILNYNNYTVRVVYDGIEYTVPAYEFVVIKR